jgi:sugar-specific transcriptional regulator TrmB
MEKLTEKLQSIGLTQNEARVYLFLLEYQEAKTGVICSKLKIPNSHIYQILEKLLDKGIVSFKIVNNIKVFRPVDPESLYSLFREKELQLEREKQELREFITNLKKIEIKEPKENDFKYFEGVAGIRSMFTEFTNSWAPNSICYVSSAPIAYERWNAFLLEYFHPPRFKKKVHLQIIIPSKLKERGAERERMKYTEVKYSKKEMKSEFGVAGDYTYLLSYGERPYALLIKDKTFADTQKKIFEIMWDSIK